MAIVLGVAGCSTHAAQGPGPTQELPLLTATVETTQPPSALPTPVAEPSADDPGRGLGAPEGRPRSNVSVQAAVRLVSRQAMASAVVVDRETGDTVLAENADRQFAAGSLVKILIGWDALHRHPGDKMVRDRVFTMIQDSDDPTANSFWVAEGGTSIITRARVTMGLKSTEAPVPSTRWGNTMITANDLARVYDYIMTHADEFERNTILQAMKTASKVGSDGFKQYFGIPSAIKPPWAIKQAWATDSENHKLAHSTGFAGEDLRYVVIVLTEHPSGQSWDAATRSVTSGASAIMPELQ